MSTPETITIGGVTIGPRCSPIRTATPEARVQRHTFPGVVGASVYIDKPTTRLLSTDLTIPSDAAYSTKGAAEATMEWLQTLPFQPLRGTLNQYSTGGAYNREYARCRMVEFAVEQYPFFDGVSGNWKFTGTLTFEQFATENVAPS